MGWRLLALGAFMMPGPLSAQALSVLEGRLYRLEVHSEVTPIPLRQLHQWTLTLRDGEGSPLDGAEIEVDGGMPAHRHGLPTAPRVVASSSPGQYRLEGLRFSMRGHWEMRFRIETETGTETLTMRLDL